MIMHNFKNKYWRNSDKMTTIPFTVLGVILAATIISYIFFKIHMANYDKNPESKVYDKYYVMITDNYKSDFWQAVYKSAFEEAKAENIYLDLMGEKLTNAHTVEELMRMAIASHVDGIIVYANEQTGMTRLINEAEEKGIPVVTLYGDNTHSKRISFVGVGSFDIGRKYGRQVIDIIKEKKQKTDGKGKVQISVLVNTEMQDPAQNIIVLAIKETVKQLNTENTDFIINTVPVENQNPYSAEETIRDLFLQDEIPDVMICLNELDTVCAYQAVVDYNRVGDVDILGYSDSDKIISAIDRGVIYSTISIDTTQMGEYCVDALNDFYNFGETSEYYISDIELINRENAAEYSAKESADE